MSKVFSIVAAGMASVAKKPYAKQQSPIKSSAIRMNDHKSAGDLVYCVLRPVVADMGGLPDGCHEAEFCRIFRRQFFAGCRAAGMELNGKPVGEQKGWSHVAATDASRLGELFGPIVESAIDTALTAATAAPVESL